MDGQTYTKSNEGCRLSAYDDSTGKVVSFQGPVYGAITIGYGHTGADVHPGQVITQSEADWIFDTDYHRAELAAAAVLDEPYWLHLDATRRIVLADMAFQLGAAGLSHFGHMLAAIRAANWQEAHDQCLASRYAQQAPARARRNGLALLTGTLPAGASP